MRKEPFLSQGADDDRAKIELEFSRKAESLINGQATQIAHKVALSGTTLFFAATASIGICTIAIVAVYRTFVVPM